MTQTVGVVSAGEMGSALGAVLARGGARVLAASGGRSARTRLLAQRAGLELVEHLDDVVAASDLLISVVPPDQSGPVLEDLLERVRRLGVRPVIADLNAVDPAEVVRMARLAEEAGLSFVDGAVSGAPPTGAVVRTRLLLSGPAAEQVAELPWGAVRVSVLGEQAGAASAAKMCTAGVRKGLSALVINALLTAADHGVLEPVEAELRGTLGRDPLLDAELAATKAWRFVPEMEAVARTQQASGLDPTLHLAIADVFRRTANSPLGHGRPEDVVRGPVTGDHDETEERRRAVVAGLTAPGGRAQTAASRRTAGPVGVVGLGRMGEPIARHLVAAGFDVHAFDADPQAGAELGASVRRVDTAADLAGCDVVLVLIGGAAVADLLLEDSRLRETWRGVDVLVCSTVDPADMARLHEAASRDGGRLLDAPLCRGDHGAREGDLLALVGGEAGMLDRCRDVLAAFCSDVVLVGGPGAGQVAKLVNNLLLWSSIASVTEALRLAEQLGVRRGPLVEGLLRSSAASWVLDTWARPRELPWAHEDLRMALESGVAVGVDLPVTEVIARVIGEVRDSGALAEGGFGASGWTLPAH